ncbi:MAG TPA: hypothetical protein VIK98_09960 [Limnochordales bacterium]
MRQEYLDLLCFFTEVLQLQGQFVQPFLKTRDGNRPGRPRRYHLLCGRLR